MNRACCFWVSAALSLAGICGAAEPTVTAPRPNVIFILADDLGYSDLGCYGSEIATPTLDGLASDGLRFTQFYNTGRCWPSRAALMTGFYAQQVMRDTMPGLKGGIRGVRPAWAPMLPELLEPLGYRSLHSGKWHLDGSPLKCGFARSATVAGGDYFKSSDIHEEGVTPVDREDFYSTTAIADHAIGCLQEHAEKFAGKPFFQYIAFHSPHFPLQAPAADIARYRDRYVAGWDKLREERWAKQRTLGLVHGEMPTIQRDIGPPYAFPNAIEKLGPGEVTLALPWDQLTPEQQAFQATKMSIHAAMVDRMDKEIGRVLAQVRAMGAWENTIIFFASDNGASAEMMIRDGGHDPQAAPGSQKTYLCLGPGFAAAANTPMRRYKTWTHEGGIATPLIVHWPAGIAAKGELRQTPAHLVDIVPTVLAAAGGSLPTEWHATPVPASPGRNMLPVFAHDGDPIHNELWFCHEGNRAIRMGDWKAVALAKGEWELFNLADDRGECTNLAQQNPERLRELIARWDSIAGTMPSPKKAK